jgi:alpha-glucosidase
VPLPPDPVVYEVYVRSFADSDGDGVGDIVGITSRLDYLADLGVDALWLTPVFCSPQRDFGYDVSDYLAIHDEYGALADLDALVEGAHRRDLAVVLDMVLAHTSNQHPWFRSHPERYIWADQIPNNWISVFGGSAWQWDEQQGQYFYHRFYPEQPSLDWSNPSVREAMHGIVQHWVDRGIDAFRLDAFDGLCVDPAMRDEPPARAEDLEYRGQDSWADYWSLQHVNTCNLPKVIDELRWLTAAFPATSFVVEADLDRERLAPYLALADSCFAFELIRAPLDGTVLGKIIADAGRDGNLAWALSSHDYPRLVSRWGRDLASVAAVLLLTLPGWSFIYQGDEIGMVDGDGGAVARDRSGRDAMRHPMQWTARGGFTTGTPWLPMIDPERSNVEDQQGVAGSTLEQYRALIRLRRLLSGTVEVTEAVFDYLSYRRDDMVVALNLGDRPREVLHVGEILYSTEPWSGDGCLGPRSALIYIARH